MASIDASGGGLGQPASHAFSITVSDTTPLAYVTRAIYVGGAGNVKVDMEGGETVTFVGAVAGEILPIRATKVYSTSTTATSLLGLY